MACKKCFILAKLQLLNWSDLEFVKNAYFQEWKSLFAVCLYHKYVYNSVFPCRLSDNDNSDADSDIEIIGVDTPLVAGHNVKVKEELECKKCSEWVILLYD